MLNGIKRKSNGKLSPSEMAAKRAKRKEFFRNRGLTAVNNLKDFKKNQEGLNSHIPHYFGA